jgi:histidinol-phosphate aminotransferase
MSVHHLVRENILRLTPYSSARSEYKGAAEVFLDANESPFDTGLNRYPDPLQWKLKEKIGVMKGVSKEQIFLGNGSDEVIDLLIRIFCRPGEDHLVILPPTYGMYKVAADIAGVEVREIPLTARFQPDVDAILSDADHRSKILFLCSPNNPTGNSFEKEHIDRLVREFPGIVLVDEAYIDFSSRESCLSLLLQNPRLVVMQTLSKAWGLAGLRLGMAFASEEIIELFNRVKPPYNINQLTQEQALLALGKVKQKDEWVRSILGQRAALQQSLAGLDFVQVVHPSDANFLLVRMDDPEGVYRYLVGEKIIVRDRSNVRLCEGCLRITVGTPAENDRLFRALLRFGR